MYMAKEIKKTEIAGKVKRKYNYTTKTGRPMKYPTPELLLDAWNYYKQRKSKNNDLITKENFCRETGNDTDMILEYAKRIEFSGIVKQITDDCKYYLMQRGLKNQYNASITKLLLSHYHSVNEKTDHDVKETIQINFLPGDEKL